VDAGRAQRPLDSTGWPPGRRGFTGPAADPPYSGAVLPAREIPLRARVRLAHAAVQALATRCGVDLLHIKGPAVDPGLRREDHGGADVDVIVRPDQLDVLLAALTGAGWRRATGFTAGSPFDHAANYVHEHWGLLDVHRTYPGLDADPGLTFRTLWRDRRTIQLAAVDCAVPDRTAQSLILLLHAARTRAGGGHPDIGPNWSDLEEEQRRQIRDLAATLHAEVGLAAATGELGRYAGDPRAALWRAVGDGGSRLAEWRARVRAAPTARAKASVALRSLGVNRYYLEQRLGHPASRTEMAREFARRIGRAGREGAALVRPRARRTGGRR